MSSFQDFARLHFVYYNFFVGTLTGDITTIAVMLSTCNLGMSVQNPLRSKEKCQQNLCMCFYGGKNMKNTSRENGEEEHNQPMGIWLCGN